MWGCGAAQILHIEARITPGTEEIMIVMDEGMEMIVSSRCRRRRGEDAIHR